MGKPRMALFAGDQGIMTGEELTYDYNFNPYSIKNVQECRCGADNCRGVLGPKPKDVKEALNPIANGAKRKLQQAVEHAVEGVKQAAKKRKLNVPVPQSVKSAITQTKDTITGTKKPKEKPSNKKRLPLGWVYVDDISDPPPPIIRNVFENDPEQLMKRSKKKIKEEESQTPPAVKKLRLKQDAIEFKLQHARRNVGKFTEGLESDEEDTKLIDERVELKTEKNSVRKNVVRTIKGRNGKVELTTGKSIRVIGSP